MLETLAMSSVLITALCLIRMARGRVSARLIYSLWLVAALRLMLPFSLAPSPVSAMNLGGLVTEVAAPQAEAFSGDTAYEARPQAPAELTLPDAQPERDETHANTAPAPAGGTTEYIPASDEPGRADTLRLIWLAGGCALAAALIMQNGTLYFRLRGERRRLELNYASRPVYVAASLPSPCLFGVLRPSVYLTPASLETDERARMAVLHEETHFRHGDHIWALLRCALLCVYWFDPFVWLAACLSRRDAEFACDEGCLVKLGAEQRRVYGRALIDLVDRGRRTDILLSATTMSGGKRAVKERVKRIAASGRPKLAAAILVAALALIISACTFTGASRDEAGAARPLRNATAFMYNDDFWSNETGHYCVISGNNSHVLALHWKDNRSNMNLRLPVSVPDGFGPIGAFMSDEMGAVCCLDGEGGLLTYVNPDRGSEWNEAAVEAGSEGECFIGFSSVSDGWLAYVSPACPDDPEGGYRAVFWLTDDSGESWVRVPYEQRFEGRPVGFALTSGGEAFAAVNCGYGDSRVLRSEGPGSGWSVVSSIGDDSVNSPIPNGPKEARFSARPPYVANNGDVVYTFARHSVEYSGAVSHRALTGGFWRIPSDGEGSEEGTALAPGLYVVPLRDINGEFAHRFWNRQFGSPARGDAEINIWAALYTTEERFELEVRSVFEDGSRILPGERYGEYTLDPDTLLLIPVVSLEPGDNGIGILFSGAADGAVGTCFSSPEAGQLDLTPISDPEDTGHGVYLRGATEDFLARQEAYDVFGGYPEDEPGVIYCAICASETVYDLEVFSLVLGEEYGTQPSRGETLYSQAELNPGRPLVVGNVSVGDVTPARGFSFRTEDGVMYEYYIDLAYATMIDGSFRPYALGTAAAGTGFGVFADAATAGVMSRFDEYDEADISGGAENTREVVLYSDTSIGALRVFALDWSSGYIKPSEGKTVFEKGGLWPARPIVLTVPNESMTPLFGFAFEGGGGAERGYYAYADGSGDLHLSPLWSGQDVSAFEPFDTGLGLTANYAATELFEQYERWVIDRGFPDAEENVIMAALRTDVPLANFRYFALDYPEGGITPAEGRLINDFNGVFNPDQLFVVGFTQPGLTSTRGIAFTDADGAEHRFALAISGEDGSIVLEEF